MQSLATPLAVQAIKSVTPLSAFMPVPDAADRIGKSREFLYRRLRDGLVPGVKFGRSRMIRRRFVEEFLAQNAAGQTADFDGFAADWMARESQAVAS